MRGRGDPNPLSAIDGCHQWTTKNYPWTISRNCRQSFVTTNQRPKTINKRPYVTIKRRCNGDRWWPSTNDQKVGKWQIKATKFGNPTKIKGRWEAPSASRVSRVSRASRGHKYCIMPLLMEEELREEEICDSPWIFRRYHFVRFC